MNLKEQIEKLRKKLDVMVEKRDEINDKALGESRTLSEDEAKQYDETVGEIKGLKTELNRLEALQAEREEEEKQAEADKAKAAKPVDPSPEKAAANRGDDKPRIQVASEAKGAGFAKFAKVLVQARSKSMPMDAVAKGMYPDDQRIQNVAKAAVAAGTTSDATWVGALVGDESAVFADFVEYLRPMTILGRFGTNGIPDLRRVPFRVPLIGQTSGGSGYWVGEGKAKPLTKFDFNRTTLEPLKVANIAVLSEEAIMYSSPAADVLVRDQLAQALAARLDVDFIDPAKTAVANISPASITNGATSTAASGTGTADDVRADLRTLYSGFIAANNTPSNAVLIMNGTTALALSLMTNALGQPEFPTVTMTGGTLNGVPVIVSEYIPSDSTGSIVVMANASDIYLGDEGGIMVDMSREASLEMDNAPSHNSDTPTGTSLVSLWQTNSVAMRAERFINWSRRRESSVAYLTGVNWGA